MRQATTRAPGQFSVDSSHRVVCWCMLSAVSESNKRTRKSRQKERTAFQAQCNQDCELAVVRKFGVLPHDHNWHDITKTHYAPVVLTFCLSQSSCQISHPGHFEQQSDRTTGLQQKEASLARESNTAFHCIGSNCKNQSLQLRMCTTQIKRSISKHLSHRCGDAKTSFQLVH